MIMTGLAETVQMTDASPADPAFPPLLKRWRANRRISQLELSLAAEVSQRHISFLESGRAMPSRSMVLQLGHVLDVPLRDRNRLLTAAGFAPVFEARTFDDPDMAPIVSAIELTLKHHEPNPAVVVDRNWNVLMYNDALYRAFTALVGNIDAMWEQVGAEGERNLLKLTFHPDGLRQYIANWREIGPILIGRTRREAEVDSNAVLDELLDEILAYPGIPKRWYAPDRHKSLPPVLPLEYDIGGTRLRLFSMLSTFGTAQDVTADELRIESFFPADETSAALLRTLSDHTAS